MFVRQGPDKPKEITQTITLQLQPWNFGTHQNQISQIPLMDRACTLDSYCCLQEKCTLGKIKLEASHYRLGPFPLQSCAFHTRFSVRKSACQFSTLETRSSAQERIEYIPLNVTRPLGPTSGLKLQNLMWQFWQLLQGSGKPSIDRHPGKAQVLI